jgi:probable selenium-dependent hydroxylase accessory protein YqeC
MTTDLITAFDFHLPELVSLVGSGGKTTLMYALARAVLAKGGRVLTTTTTKIMSPSPEESPAVIVSADLHVLWAEVQAALKKQPHVTMGVSMLMDGKLAGVPPAMIDDLYAEKDVDLVVVEADGSKNLPLKAPGGNEPVIPFDSTVVVPVIGLSGLGRPLDNDTVFRPERFTRMAELEPGGIIEPVHVARVMFHKEGLCRDAPDLARIVPFLNQADLMAPEAVRAAAKEILRHSPDHVDRVIWGALRHPERGFEVLTPDDL